MSAPLPLPHPLPPCLSLSSFLPLPLSPFLSLLSSDTYVTAESGTGVVHQAPGFGEDDFRVCKKFGIVKKGEQVVCPVDASGKFTDEVVDFKGEYVKVTKRGKMKSMGLLFSSSVLPSSLPFPPSFSLPPYSLPTKT